MIRRIYDAEMSDVILDHLLTLPVEYREYKRYNKVVCVPRGQLAFTTSSSIHYDYGKVSGGTPSVLVLKQGDRLMDITSDVNKALGTEFNTILMNVYRDGSDYISAHKDNTTGWVEGTGFATLSFGATRDFIIKSARRIDLSAIAIAPRLPMLRCRRRKAQNQSDVPCVQTDTDPLLLLG